jgi:hypothetical protein
LFRIKAKATKELFKDREQEAEIFDIIQRNKPRIVDDLSISLCKQFGKSI